jgi:hypothetical protein
MRMIKQTTLVPEGCDPGVSRGRVVDTSTLQMIRTVYNKTCIIFMAVGLYREL